MTPPDMPQQRIRVIIDLSYEEFRPYYDGLVKNIVAPSLEGQSIRFPAHVLRPYLIHSGIRGVFELCMDENNRLVSCERIAEIK